ncbi:peptide-N-glycosidase [Empedobacter sp. 225-1]|uniref:PNGase F N-terminal domain-containing protein n=1 Tax=unclassified Empedobacter TaxID=2643773 RepID=UPI002576A6E7|nr:MULTISPECIES: PNGase F N-terminal domain-containing protein [unclassified Empedobacter]MDM1522803.1 peptide-N-glycosidase [Empedobacter sp. 225-1]MDM1542863.1 peptide-N-glycosidase [Empedobacter sp. 189-2]
MKSKSILFIMFCIQAIALNAQETYKITYERFSNGKKVIESNPIQVLANTKETIIGKQESFHHTTNYPDEMVYYTKTNPSVISLVTQFDSVHSIISNDSIALNKSVFTITKETKRILGLRCKKATTSINSNTIDVWFVDNMDINAAPTIVGLSLGFVLEFTRNNNMTIRASKIERQKEPIPSQYIAKELLHEPVDILTYKDIIWKSKFVDIPLLTNQQINFSNNFLSNDSIYRFVNGTVVVRKIKLPLIKEGSQIFLNVTQQSNGDAYDRTGSVFLIPRDSKITFMDALQKGINQLPVYTAPNNKKYQGYFLTENYTPTIELMRFFTPFGINKFNHIQLKGQSWETEARYRQEITELQRLLSNQEVLVGFFIGNYDQGGHTISANITVHPSNSSTLPNKKVQPIFNTTNIMEMAGQEYPSLFDNPNGFTVEFTLKEDYNNAKLRFTTTGHGGWENGDEFVPKENSVFLDGQNVFNIIPWRQDCGSYRAYNPASGNFDNGLSSSDYSRSNWCPGTVTNPFFIDLGNLKAGKHSLQVKIPQGKPEGNAFSYWNVSGVLLGE